MPTGPESQKPVKPPAPVAAKPAAEGASADQPVPADKLTPEEQMERFARDQKENDWGHQPC